MDKYAKLIDGGVSFYEFAMRFAADYNNLQAEGDDTIPERIDADTWHLDRICEFREKRNAVAAMSDSEAEHAASEEYASSIANRRVQIDQKNELRAKCESILASVDAWNPPTIEDVDLKKYMIQRLVDVIKEDCTVDYILERVPVRMSGEEWKAKTLARLDDDIKQYSDQQCYLNQQADSKNKWLRDFRASIRAVSVSQ